MYDYYTIIQGGKIIPKRRRKGAQTGSITLTESSRLIPTDLNAAKKATTTFLTGFDPKAMDRDVASNWMKKRKGKYSGVIEKRLNQARDTGPALHVGGGLTNYETVCCASGREKA